MALPFAFNFGGGGDDDDDGIANDGGGAAADAPTAATGASARGKRYADSATQQERPSRRQRGAGSGSPSGGPADRVSELRLPPRSDSDDSSTDEGGLKSRNLAVASFEGGVNLRIVSSELARNEMAAFPKGASGAVTAAAATAADDKDGSTQRASDGDKSRKDDGDDDDSDEEPPAVLAEARGSDLIPRVYEGGLKVWEGAGDLVNCMISEGTPLAGAVVLELGCGAGLPGIYAATAGAVRVDFTDYNREVLEHLTMPNYSLNMSAADGAGREPPRFLAGSWVALEKHLGAVGATNSYDVVLTAETLYSPESMPELYSLIKAAVKRPGGVALVASKTYYFGVGGGTHDFCRQVERDGHFEARTVFESVGGVKREVIELRVSAGRCGDGAVSAAAAQAEA